jgi:hypothetical protein
MAHFVGLKRKTSSPVRKEVGEVRPIPQPAARDPFVLVQPEMEDCPFF